MKFTSKIAILLSAVLMCIGAASCKKDTTIQYYNGTLGNVVGEVFISDQGNIFHVVEQSGTSYEDLLKTERAYILCDILNKTVGGESNEYDIRLHTSAKVLVKDIIVLGTETTEEMLKEDPIDIRNIWISGGYLNLYIEFLVKKGSQTPHLVNLIQKEAEEGYLFRFTHNASGETIENYPDEAFEIAGGYISFPINKVIRENEAKLIIEWTRYKSSGMSAALETEVAGVEGTYKKNDFEHMPQGPADKAKAVIR